MAIRPDYVTGTITLTSGSTSFTTAGSALQAASVKAGDEIITRSGNVLIIASITGQNSGTLMQPCPAAAAGAAQPLRIRYQPDGSRYQGAARDLISRWGGSGNVDALAGLVGENGKLPIFTGAGTMGLVDKGDVGIQDPNGNLGDLAALTLAANKALTTDGSGSAQQSDLGTLGRALLALASGTTAQYVRGDGTLQALNKAAVGLGNVDNTSDAAKPISSATQTALNAKANLSGATFTGTVTFGGGLGVNNNFLIVREFGVQRWGLDFIASDGSLRFQTFIDGTWAGPSVTLLPNKNVQFAGTISKGGGTFEIDHPLDPFNKNLRHGFVESTEYLNIYRGEVRLVNGRATVNIDEFFGMSSGTFWALNADITVSSLQNQESFDRLKPGAALDNGTFEIVCENENSTDLVAWMVTGRRNDPFVKSDLDPNTDSNGRFVPEFEKEDA